MSIVTTAQIQSVAPIGHSDIIAAIVDHADTVFPKYGLTTLDRVQIFLGLVIEETGGLRVTEEGLDYSADRLHQVWPARFPTVQAALPFAHNPRALANKVYMWRMGNMGPDDGWRYRGQGLIQVTGHDNFALIEHLTGLPLVEHPELAASADHMLECAAALFSRYTGIMAACDRGDYRHVWALVGGGQINVANHEMALAHVRAAIPALGSAQTASTVIRQTVLVAAATPQRVPLEVGDISGLQAALNSLGVVSPPLDVDGNLGIRTKQAVMAFQTRAGLPQDGVPGRLTMDALNAELAKH